MMKLPEFLSTIQSAVRRSTILVAGFVSLWLFSRAAHATDYTYVSGVTNGNWGNNTLWLFANAPPTNGSNTDIFIEGSDNSPDIQDNLNNDVDYDIDSLTLSAGYASGSGDITLSGGKLTIDGFIANNEDSAELNFSDVINMGDNFLAIQANTADIDFNATVDLFLNTSTLSVSGGQSVFFDGGINDPQDFITDATLSISGGTFVRIGNDSTVLSDVSISDGTLLINSSSNLNSNANVSVFQDGTFDLNDFNVNVDVLTGSGSVDLGSGTLTFGEFAGNVASFEFSGVISGTGGIVKNQSGETVLSGANTYSGTTTVSNGTLRTAANHRIGNASDIIADTGGTFDINGFEETVDSISGSGDILLGNGGLLRVDQNGGSYEFSGTISESGELEKIGTATLILSGSNSFSLLDIDAGTVQVSSQSNMGSGSVEMSGGTLHTTATFTNSLPINTNSANSTFLVDNTTFLTQSEVISGSGGIVKEGNGNLVLDAANTYTGDTVINDGILRLNASNRISNSSDVVMVTGASFFLENFTDTVNSLSGTGGLVSTGGTSGRLTVNASSGTFTWSGGITGSGGLTKSGNHTMVITAAQAFTGAANINDGILEFTGGGSFSTSTDVSVASGATWDLNGINDSVDSISGGGTIVLAGATLTVDESTTNTRTFSGAILGSGSLSKTGAHTLVLSGNNTFDGEVSLSGGTLRVGTSNNLGSTSTNLVFFGGTLQTTGSFANPRDIFIGPSNSATFNVDASTTHTLSGLINGDSATTIFKLGGGTLTTTAANAATFTGDIVIDAGTFDMAGGGDALANATAVTVNAGGTFLVNNPDNIGGLSGSGSTVLNTTLRVGADGTSTTYSGVISGAGLFGKIGSGTMTLAGNNTYTGTTDIDVGILRLSGGGRIANQSDVDVASGATFDLNGVSDTIDALVGAGSVTLGGGTLTVGANNGSGTFSGNISESGGFVKVGNGTQTLSGVGSWSNGTQVNGGTLRVTGSTSTILGTGSITLDGGTLETTSTQNNLKGIILDAGGGTVDVDTGTTFAMFAGTPFSGVGSLTKADNGILQLSTNNTYGGDTFINGGTVQHINSGSLPNSTNVVVAAGATWDLNNISDTINSLAGGGIVRLGTGTLTVTQDGGSRTFLGNILESGGLTKNGTHTLVLSGLNSYSGPTTINAGTIQISEDFHLGDPTNDLIFGGGTLYIASSTVDFDPNRSVFLNAQGGTVFLEGSSAMSIPGIVTGPGTFHIESDNENTLVLSGVNTYTGGTSIVEAFVDISQNANLGANSGSVTMEDALLLTDNTFTNSHAIVLNGGTSGFSVGTGATLTHNAPISGTGTLGIYGSGTTRLTQPATHAGNTIISGSATLLFGSGELPDAFDVTVNNPTSTWDLNGVSDTIDGLFGAGTVLLGGGTLTVGAGDGDGDFSGSIQESGGFVKTGSGMQILSGINTYTASTTIDEGVLQIVDNNSLGAVSASLIFNDGTLRTTSTISTGRATTINSSGTFDVAAGTTLTFTSPIDGAGELVKSDAGTLQLTQSNTYQGVTDIVEGTLRLSGAGQLADQTDVLVAAGASFDLTDLSDTIDSLIGEGTVALGNGTLTIGANNGGGTFSGVITGTGIGGMIVKEGTGTEVFAGANTYAGGTEINGGTLQISQDQNLGELGGQVDFDGGTLRTTADIPNMVREITMNAGGGTIEVDAGTTFGIGGNIAGIGELSKTGDGTLVLSGISSYAGTNVLAGVLSVGFNFNLGNANGELTIDGATLRTTNNFTTSRLTTIGSGGATFDVEDALLGVDHTHDGIIQSVGSAAAFIKTGAGAMRLTGVNTFTSPIQINAGRLETNASNQLGNALNTIVFGGGTWFVDGTFDNGRSVQLNQNGGVIEVAGGTTLTQSGVIEDGANGPAGPLTKSGSGNLRLSAANTYSSGTNIQAGVLQLLGAGQLPDTTDLDVAAGSTFDLNSISDAIDALTGNGDVTLGAGTLTIGSNDGGGTFSGTLSGTGGLTKIGTGTQELRLNEVGDDDFPNTYSGGTQINGGVLDVEEDNNLGDPTGTLGFDGGTLQVSVGDGGVSTTRLVTLNAGGGTVNTVNMTSTVTLSGVISGSGSLTKNGQGSLTLAANNTYTGDTLINGGIFRLEGAGRIPDASYVTVEASGNMGEGLDLNNISDTIRGLEGGGDVHLGSATLSVGSAGGDFDGRIDGTGGLAKIGAGGNLILAGINTYQGGTAINGGSIEIDADIRLGNTSGPLSFDGGTLITVGNFGTARVTTMNAGGGTFDVPGSNTFTHNGGIAGVGSLAKSGTGTLVLTAVSSYGSATNISQGILQLAGAERLPNTTSMTVDAAATFDMNNFNETIDGLSGAGIVDLTDAQLTVGISGGSGSFSGVINGSGDFQKEGTGTQTLAGGTHGYSGATVVNGGELILNGGGSIDQTTLSVGFNNGSNGTTTVTGSGTTWDLSGNLIVGAQGIGRLNIDNGAEMNVGGQIAIGTGTGEGTILVDDGLLDNSGGTGILVQDGTLGGRGTVIGNVINQDTLAPGTSAGVLNLTGTYVQEITGTFAAEVAGTGVGQFDVLNVSSTASLAGDLSLSMLGFAPAPSDTFTILSAGSLVGVFANVADGARLNITSGGTGSFQVDYTSTSVILSDFVGTVDVLPGDFNNDGTVDGSDFLLWQRGGSPNPLSSGDLALWQSNYGNSIPATAASSAVPEPSAMLLVSILALTVLGSSPRSCRSSAQELVHSL